MIHDQWPGNDLDEVAVAKQRYCPIICLDGMRKNCEKVRIADDHPRLEPHISWLQYLFRSHSEFYYMLRFLWNKHSRRFLQFVFISKLCIPVQSKYWSHCHIHGTLIFVISTVHDTWLDGSPLAWAYFRSSPVTRSQGVPCNGDSICSIFLPVIKEQCNMSIH
jgi:hypothetical protein